MNVLETVMYYKEIEEMAPNNGALREVKMQYADMANGGDGGLVYIDGGTASCRDVNYFGYSDSFFQEVCALLGWKW